MENCETLLLQLQKVLATFNKNPSRQFSARNLLHKLTKLKEIDKKFKQNLQQLKESKSITKESLEEITNKFNDILLKTKLIIDRKSKEIYSEEDDSEYDSEASTSSKKMAMNTFDLATAIKIIPQFSGEIEDVENFLKITEIYEKTLSAEAKVQLIEFIWFARLSQKAKNKLATASTPTTYKQLEETLKGVFKPTETSNKIHSRLANIKQQDFRVKDYSEKILSLVEKLNKLQISELGESNRDVIKKLNDKMALNAFQSGLRENIKPTILAAQCKTLNEAISLAEQVEKPVEEQVRMFQYNRRQHSYNNNASSRNRFANSNNQQTNLSKNYRKHECCNCKCNNKTNYNNKGNSSYYQNKNRQHHNGYNNNNRRNNSNRNNRMHFFQTAGDNSNPE